jgi:hypothetical protein
MRKRGPLARRPHRDTRQKASSIVNSMIARTALVAALAAAVSGSAVAADAPTANVALAPLYAPAALDGPIHIDRVQIAPADGIHNNFAYLGIVTVAFTNTSAVPATGIVFAVRGTNGAIIDRFTDAGTYEKGVSVRHSFTDVQSDPNQSLEVETATFADGSEWTNPGPDKLKSLRQAQ